MKKNILLVDDNAIDVEFTCHVLKSCEVDHEVFIGRDGEEALHCLENEPVVDLVLLDLKLPKVDGFDVLERAAANRRMSRSDHRREFVGAAGYIVKSMGFAEFRRALKAELSKHLVC